jgi:hypothetical protein
MPYLPDPIDNVNNLWYCICSQETGGKAMATMYVTLKLDSPAVVALYWKALCDLPLGPMFPEDDGGRGARYDKALLNMVQAGYTPSMADQYIV